MRTRGVVVGLVTFFSATYATAAEKKCESEGQHCRYFETATNSYEVLLIEGKFRKCEDNKTPERPAIKIVDDRGTCDPTNSFGSTLAVTVRRRTKNLVSIEILIGPPDLRGKQFDVPRDQFDKIAPSGPKDDKQYFSLDTAQSLNLKGVLHLGNVKMPGNDVSVKPF